MRVKLFSYKPHSSSARRLAESLGIKRLKHEGSKYRPRNTDVIINWGSSRLPIDKPKVRKIINDPDLLGNASNKLVSLRMLHRTGVSHVPFTADPDEAMTWPKVVVRHKLTGHSGQGIEIWEGDGPLPDAPLYTRYIKKSSEWRVHVCDGQAFFTQRKVRNWDVPNDQVNWDVRNHQAGFIYQMNNEDVPDIVVSTAEDALEASGLDIGAVDLIYNTHHQQVYVLEINTAPGLRGDTTLAKYVQVLSELIESYQ